MPDINKDPVCGMDVQNEAFSAEHEGKTYYFCSASDRQKFMQNPREYAENAV